MRLSFNHTSARIFILHYQVSIMRAKKKTSDYARVNGVICVIEFDDDLPLASDSFWWTKLSISEWGSLFKHFKLFKNFFILISIISNIGILILESTGSVYSGVFSNVINEFN